MTTVLRTQALSKTFRVGLFGRPVTVLEHLDLEVRQGEVFGFLGPNGAGKTTTVKILLGLLSPTSGQAWLLDRAVGDVAVKQQIGFLPESPYFYDYLTGEEFLRFYGRLFGLDGRRLADRITALLTLVSLRDARRLQLRKFSKGMLQRIGIAQALLNDPTLVMLDEPMSGLDPIGRKDIRDLILRLKGEGKTIFFSSHLLHDAEALCDRVGLLVKGRLVAVGRVVDLAGEGVTHDVEAVVDGLDAEGLARLETMATQVVARGPRVFCVVQGQSRVNELLDLARDRQARVLSLTPQKSSLEDLFIREVREQHSHSSEEWPGGEGLPS